jgi:hypothetical protein
MVAMHTRAEVLEVERLATEGLGRNEIARRAGIPRSTVGRWLHDGGPEIRSPEFAALDAPAYCHLLGLYLGDGHVASFPRTFCLRIYLDRRYAYTRYSFSKRSNDIKAILCAHLDLLGIAWRRAGDVNISIARREAVAALDAFVGPKR